MRVGVVCPYSLSMDGGVQCQVVGLARALGRLGHCVEVIAPGDVLAGVDGTSAGGAFRFRVNGSIAPMAPQPLAAIRTVRALRRGRFDVLHLHEPLAPSITVAALLAATAPIVGTFHAAGDRTPYRWLGSSLRPLADRIDACVAVSESAADLARRHLGGSYEILYNGIDVDQFQPARPATVDRPPILFVGRHEPRKGLDVLLDAFSWLPATVALRVVGDGPATGDLRKRYGDPRIVWLGRLSEADKIRQLHTAAVVCVPSRYGESFGMVLLEAMAAGTPIVASDVPGFRSVSGDGRAALLIPPGNPRALAAGLLRVLSDDRIAARLRAEGAKRVHRFSMDALAARYVNIYEHVTRSKLR